MSKSSAGFGREEMAALIGGDNETFSGRTKKIPTTVSGIGNVRRKDGNDLSDLSAAQTAALLKEKDAAKNQKLQRNAGGRLRAQKKHATSNREALLLEEERNLERKQQMMDRVDSEGRDIDDSDSDDDFLRSSQNRTKLDPVIVSRSKIEPQVVHQSRRRRRQVDSSSSSEIETENDSDDRRKPVAGRRREKMSTSSSSSDDDDRRRRILAKRKRRVLGEDKDSSATLSAESKQSARPANMDHTSQQSKSRREASSSSSDSGSHDDSESSSSGSEEEDSGMVKPLFIPKHRRHVIVSQEEKEKQEEVQKAQKEELAEKRKMSSRQLVAQTVSTEFTKTSNAAADEPDDVEMHGARNPPPKDDDPTDPTELEMERDAWEMRELDRLLRVQDMEDERADQQQDYQRRKGMTEEERMLEDEALGVYKKPGQSRGDPSKLMSKRYHHQGAFYMDKDEWSKDDIRHKAKEYAMAATAEDLVDRRKLPKIMQTKKFGFANQSRYQGLAKEDTTDRFREEMPSHLLQMNKRKQKDKTL